jgi:protoheme ferro-lyase
MQHTVIPSWYQREGYIKAMATLIEKELFKFPEPQKVRTMLHDLLVPFPESRRLLNLETISSV